MTLTFLFRSGIVIASALLWAAGLRLFVGAALSRRYKLAWIACLVAAGAAIGLLLTGPQVWHRFLILFAVLPLLGAADTFLSRAPRGLPFWIRACGFELGTVFGTAGVTRLVSDVMGIAAVLPAAR